MVFYRRREFESSSTVKNTERTCTQCVGALQFHLVPYIVPLLFDLQEKHTPGLAALSVLLVFIINPLIFRTLLAP